MARQARGAMPLLTMIVAGSMVFGLHTFSPVTAEGDDLLFDYRRSVTVANEGDTAFGVQVEVVLDTAAEIAADRMRADCGDVRFKGPLGILDLAFALESGCDTATTVFYVNVPVLLSGENVLHAYFGNEKAESASDPAATFTVYEDFEDGDATGWEALGGAQIIGVDDGVLSVRTSGTKQAVVYTAAQTDRGHRVDASLKIAPGISNRGYAGLGFLVQDADNAYVSRSVSFSRIGVINDGSYQGVASGADVSVGVFNQYTVSFNGDEIHATIDGAPASVTDTTHDTGMVGIYSWWGLSGEHQLDWIRARTDPAPAGTVGDLESCTVNILCA